MQWFLSVVPGLLLIIYFIAAVFESTQSKASERLKGKNALLKTQKETIASQSVELEKHIEDKDHVIRILAHDLKNPLNNISSLMDLYEKDSDKERGNEYASMIHHSSAKAQDLVNKVLEMIVSEQRDLSVHMESVDVHESIKSVIMLLQSRSVARTTLSHQLAKRIF